MTDNRVTVSAAVRERRSVRAFLPKPVPKETVIELLDLARWAPSGGNVQPWRVHALAGEALDRFRTIVAERMAQGMFEEPQYEVYPPNLWEPHRSYRYQVGEEMYGHIGVAREDKAGRLRQFAENYRFFGAPVGMFFTFDRRFGPPQWSDVGMFMQSLMLLAVERGLDSCAQECWSRWPVTIADYLGLPSDDIVFAGMAIGYRDDDAPINRLQPSRAPVDDFATLRGFD